MWNLFLLLRTYLLYSTAFVSLIKYFVVSFWKCSISIFGKILIYSLHCIWFFCILLLSVYCVDVSFHVSGFTQILGDPFSQLWLWLKFVFVVQSLSHVWLFATPWIPVLHCLPESESESCSVVSDLCDPTDCTVCGILQARIMEWLVVPFSSESSQPRDGTHVSCIARGFFTCWATREAQEC